MFLVDHGLIDPEARFELMDGAIIPMAAKGSFHEVMRERIELWLDQPWRIGKFLVLREHTLVVDEDSLVEPDFVIYNGSRRIADAPLAARDIHLIIEVADSSWSYDITRKASKYAAFGVCEYWAFEAKSHAIRIHRSPKGEHWSDTQDHGAGESVAPLCAPDAKLTI